MFINSLLVTLAFAGPAGFSKYGPIRGLFSGTFGHNTYHSTFQAGDGQAPTHATVNLEAMFITPPAASDTIPNVPNNFTMGHAVQVLGEIPDNGTSKNFTLSPFSSTPHIIITSIRDDQHNEDSALIFAGTSGVGSGYVPITGGTAKKVPDPRHIESGYVPITRAITATSDPINVTHHVYAGFNFNPGTGGATAAYYLTDDIGNAYSINTTIPNGSDSSQVIFTLPANRDFVTVSVVLTDGNQQASSHTTNPNYFSFSGMIMSSEFNAFKGGTSKPYHPHHRRQGKHK